MQPWSSSPENTIVLTDLLRPSTAVSHQPPPLQQQRDFYVKPEPQVVPSQPGLVELPPLLPPRAPMLPAISDVLRSNSPQQQRYSYENQENAPTMNVPMTPNTPGQPYSVEPATFSATFMSTCHPASESVALD
ncbi:unnamed protein product [Phytophthora lilii]|uniref:Unnamed protein product n=1 Tax=Phytophthora lilii TaxID=2077276 RepID=A0A9W6TA81_9STRA|nr:unnamed protein product [Phytophthora lilii]